MSEINHRDFIEFFLQAEVNSFSVHYLSIKCVGYLNEPINVGLVLVVLSV